MALFDQPTTPLPTLTPDSVKQRRLLAALQQRQGMDYSPVQSPWQGAARVANALVGTYEGFDADKQEALAKQAAQSRVGALLSGGADIGFPQHEPAASAPAASPQASGPAPQNRQAFIDALMPAAIEASKQTGVDPRLIVGQAAVESGWGQHAPGNNYFGIKSHGQPGGNQLATTEYENGQPVRTSASFRAYASPEDSVKGYADFITQNPRYGAMRSAPDLDSQLAALGKSGYATDPNYANTVGSIARGLPAPPPVQVASLDPSAGIGRPAPASAPQIPPQAPPQAASAPQAPPQQVAQAGGMNMQKLMQALSDPWLDDGQKQLLLMQARQSMAQDREGFTLGPGQVRYDTRGNKIAAGPEKAAAGQGEFGLNPIWGVDAQGNPAIIQLGKDGTPIQPKLPAGIAIAKDPIKIDAGTETVLLDPVTRQPIARVPKNIVGEEVDKATGKALGEAKTALPNVTAQAETMLGMINDLKTDKRRAGSTGGFDHFFNAIPGTSGYDYQQKVNQLQGQTFLQAFNALKGAGQITEIEGKKATEALGRLNTAQSDDAFLTALNDLEGIVKAGVERAKTRAGGGAAVLEAGPPAGVDANVWKHMTPEERALWK